MAQSTDFFQGFDNDKDPTKRDYSRIVVFGEQGQGKSTFISQFVAKYMAKTTKKVKRRVLILDPSNARAFDGYRQISYGELLYGEKRPGHSQTFFWNEGVRVLRGMLDWRSQELYLTLADKFKNGLLVLDESRDLFQSINNPGTAQNQLLTVHRNNCVDVMCISHNFMDLPRAVRKQFRYYVCFKTGDMVIGDGRKWFEQRNLPADLYNAWLFLSRVKAPSSRMAPFMWFDANELINGLYYDKAQGDKITVRVSPNKTITLNEYLSQK
jgi:hypothetical protein